MRFGFMLLGSFVLVSSHAAVPTTARLTPPFIENEGQAPESVRFYLPTPAGLATVDRSGRVLYARPGLTERWIGGEAEPAAGTRSTTQINYLVGDSSQWRRNVAAYDDVSLGEVWPGIEVDLIAGGGNLEKRFTIAPAARVDSIRVKLAGARQLRIADDGELVAVTAAGETRFTAPVAWQEAPDQSRHPVPIRYALRGKSYGFHVGDYDPGRPLFIDPLISGTFLGGHSSDSIVDIALDPVFGQVFAAGSTADFATFPARTTGPVPVAPFSVFIAKFSANLGSLDVLTFFGTGGLDTIEAIAYDADLQRLFITGVVDSGPPANPLVTVMPTPQNPVPHPTRTGRADSYIVSLSRDLSTVLAGTWLGGSGNGCGNGSRQDETHDIAVHPITNDVYVTGETCSLDFPNTAGSELNPPGSVISRGFVSRFNTDLTTHFQSTYFVGNIEESPFAIAVHPTLRKIFIAGESESDILPSSAGGFQTSQSAISGFVSRLSEDLRDIEVSTFLGGGTFSGNAFQKVFDLLIGPDNVGGPAGSGAVFAYGWTSASDFPGLGAGSAQTQIGGGIDTFIARLRPDLANVINATLFGGEGMETPTRLTQRLIAPANDGENDLYITGSTTSCALPRTAFGTFPTCSANASVFVAVVDENLDDVERATYLGNDASSNETGQAILVGGFPDNDIYVGGSGARGNFPLGNSPGAFPAVIGAGDDAFLVRFDTSLSGASLGTNLSVSIFESADPVGVGADFNYFVPVSVVGLNVADATGVVLTMQLAPTLNFRFAIPEAGGCSELNDVVTCALGTIPRGTSNDVDIGVTALGPPGVVSVRADVTANEPEADGSDNTQTVTTTVTVGNLVIVDSILPADDLSLPFGSVGLLNNRRATVTVTNNGASTVQIGATVGDPLVSTSFTVLNPAACFGQDLLGGQSCVLNVEFSPQALGIHNDDFRLTFAGLSPAIISVSGTGVATSADLAVTQTVDDATLASGDVAIFRLTLRNNGPDPTLPVVTDTVPAGLALIPGMQPVPSVGSVAVAGSTVTWDGFVMGEGTQATLDIPVQAITVNPTVGCATNTATASIHPSDPASDSNAGNDSASVTMGLPTCADLSIVNSFITDTIRWRADFQGFNIDVFHSVRVRNDGPSPASGVQITASSYITEQEDAPIVTQFAGVIAPGATVEVPFHTYTVVGAGSDLNVTYTIAVSATAPNPEPDPVTANNSETGGYVIVRTVTGSGFFCFIATAAYGSYLEPEVALLRGFRDRFLLTNVPGRAFVDWYYRVSPPIAEFIAEREWARALVRGLLTPVVYTIRYPAPAGFAWLLAMLVPLWWRQKRRERQESPPSILRNSDMSSAMVS